MNRFILSSLIFAALITSRGRAEGQPPVTISFDRNRCTVSIDSAAAAASISFEFREVIAGEKSLSVKGQTLISGDSLFVGDRSVSLRTLTVTEVVQEKGNYLVRLVDAPESGRSRRTLEPADRFGAFERIEVPAKDFVRGSVFVVGGSIHTQGEVNGYVITFFGDIELGPSGTCHRDVFAIGGRLKRDVKSRIYGAYQATESWKRSDIFRRRKRLYGHRPVEWSQHLSYNRVDGLSVAAGISFHSEENAMPRFYAEAGYGLASEQGKYRLGFDHRLFDYNQLTYGGAVHRLTRTDDDWICGRDENTVYSLLFKQDWRDYYLAEGAELFVEQRINSHHRLRLTYTVEELDSLPANPRLWSVLGPSDFRANFSSLPEPTRAALTRAYSGNGAELSLSYQYATVPDDVELPISGWWAAATYQHASESIASDLAYDRWRLEIRRYQELTEFLSLNGRAAFGRVTGAPPAHRLFYLGGIRTLRAHDIKEFSGNYLALLDLEYLVNPRVTVLDFGVLFDVGTVGNKSDFLSRERWRGDFGLAVIVGQWIRLELTLPFNGSSDALKPSILIGQSF